ncbi:MAG TPA: D-aminoacylase [Gemmatimonadales bacterium]|nr:D-aminoacylase [Gemmatimonadales bacterium]
MQHTIGATTPGCQLVPHRLVALLTLLASAILLSACSARLPSPQAAARYDVVIAGGTVVDGTGSPGFRADVAVRGDRIVRIDRRRIDPALAMRVIDATGMIVAPGFIDIHPHIEALLSMPGAESKVRQGVTTMIGGPDGGSPWPIGRALAAAESAGIGPNVGYFVGHNTIRREVMGLSDRAPTPEELSRMRAMVAQAMGEGAWGLSTGLIYLPGTFATTDEIVALAEVAGDSGGIYISHIRNENDSVLLALEEVFTIGRRARLPVVITHHKVSGLRQWGMSVRTLAMIDSARAAGLDVGLDQYPYTATSTSLGVLVPAWALAGGDTAFARRLRDPVLRDSILRAVTAELDTARGGRHPSWVQFARVSWQRDLEGRTLADWARARGMEPTPAASAELVLEAMQHGAPGAVYHVLHEEDVQRIMRHPLTIVASDGSLARPGLGHPHPRAYGTFPRVLGRYVRELQVLRLEEAVRRMTSMPAARVGIANRGRVAEGWFADLVVFDPATVADRATFENPHQYPTGIPWVLVNGVAVVENGTFTDARPGRALRR